MFELKDSYFNATAAAEVAQPLSDTTRRDRTALLASNIVLFLAAQGGVVPSKIAAWGLEAGQIKGWAFLFVLYGLVLYFLVAFALSAWADYRVWQTRMTFLKSKMFTPWETEGATEWDEGQVRKLILKIPGSEALSPEDFELEVTKMSASIKQRMKELIDLVWKRYAPPFTRRMYFDVWVPIGIAIVNGIAAIIRQCV